MRLLQSENPVSRWLAGARVGRLRLDLLLFVASCVLLVGWPQLDLWVVAASFDSASDTFVGASNVWLDHWVGAFDEAHFLILALCVAGFLTGWVLRSARGQAFRRGALFLFLLLLLAPGLAVNGVLKEQWGRARPQSLSAYHGDKTFTRAWQITDQCKTNCAFTSGHAAIGFYFIGLAWAFGCPRLFWVGMLVGMGLGAARIVQGRHYLSDVVFSFWVVYGTALWLSARIWPRPRKSGDAENGR